MKIEYSLTLKEYYRYQGLLIRRSLFNSPLATYSFAAIWAVILLFPWANNYYMRHVQGLPLPPDTVNNLMFDAIPSVGFLAGFALFMPLAWLLDRRYSLEINREGVAFKLGRATGHSPWSTINRVDQDDSYVYIGSKGLPLGKLLITSYNDPVMKTLPLAMLPKRVFSSTAEAQAFLGQAQAYQREASGSDQSPRDAWPPAPTGGSL